MPVTPNVLLQAAAQASTQKTAAAAPVKPAEPRDKASGFAQVYAHQARTAPVAAGDTAVKAMRDKVSDGVGSKDTRHDVPAAGKSAVADSGKSLPADTSSVSDDDALDNVAEPTDVPLAQAVTPVLTPEPAPPEVPTEPAAVAVSDQAQAAAVIAALPGMPVVVATDPEFDPQADPLDALPALRMAMEHSGHVSASSQAQPSATKPAADGEPSSAQNFAAGMASMLEVQADADSAGQGGDKAFGGLIDDGLKDLASTGSDTRVDDFANRLAALTQAATPKTANVVPVNQPIAMHQSGWTEEVVNRVMYLSSANLKAADIQLQPAELGRLDIRVNMVPDQQTQVTFMSAHAGVREALDNQMQRLRDMFVQQGMGQVDVNVADQSRGWQGQGQDQAQQGQGTRANTSGGRADNPDESLASIAAEVSATATRVIGSSAVDYYA